MAKGTKYTNQPIGTFDGLRHYRNPVTGNWVISGKGGASAAHIKKSPRLVRTRENASEFGACAKWTKQVRLALMDVRHLAWGNYTGWINQLGKTIQKQDFKSVPGTSGIYSSRHKALLTSLNFNEQHPFGQVFFRKPELSVSEDRTTFTVTIPQFNPMAELNWPRGFSYYRILLQIGQLSDYLWIEQERGYGPQYREVLGVREVAMTEWKSRNDYNVDLVLTASFDAAHLPPLDVSVIVALGIEIGKWETTGTISFSKGDGTMTVIDCV